MVKYTKGPWHVEYELDENREKTNVIFVAHPETECDMTAIAHLYNILETDEKNKANAYLIAAAPEMYEALKVIASGGEGQYQWSITKIEALAREAISKLEDLLHVPHKEGET